MRCINGVWIDIRHSSALGSSHPCVPDVLRTFCNLAPDVPRPLYEWVVCSERGEVRTRPGMSGFGGQVFIYLRTDALSQHDCSDGMDMGYCSSIIVL